MTLADPGVGVTGAKAPSIDRYFSLYTYPQNAILSKSRAISLEFTSKLSQIY